MVHICVNQSTINHSSALTHVFVGTLAKVAELVDELLACEPRLDSAFLLQGAQLGVLRQLELQSATFTYTHMCEFHKQVHALVNTRP